MCASEHARVRDHATAVGGIAATSARHHLLTRSSRRVHLPARRSMLDRTVPRAAGASDRPGEGFDVSVKHVYRVGKRARSLIGVPNVVTVMATASGMPNVATNAALQAKLVSSLGPEAAGIAELLEGDAPGAAAK